MDTLEPTSVSVEEENSSTRREKPILDTWRLSHGTLECENLGNSRRFYEEFLGLDCVQHAPKVMNIRKGGYWVIVCVEVGPGQVHPLNVLNHWGLDVPSRELVDEYHILAERHAEEYGIRRIKRPVEQHGAYSFYMQDLDWNWWEIEYVPDDKYDRRFENGDQFGPYAADPK